MAPVAEEGSDAEAQEFQMEEQPARGRDLRDESAAPREQKRSGPKLPGVIGVVAVLVVIAVVIALLFFRKTPGAPGAPGRPGTQADPFDYAVAANADMVFDVDFAALRGAALWKTIADAIGDEEARAGKSPLESLIRSIAAEAAGDADELAKIEKGIDVMNKIERVYGGGVSESQQALFVMSASSDADWDGLLALARESAEEEGVAIEEAKIGEYTAYRATGLPGPAQQDVWVVRYSDRIAIAGSEALVRGAVDAMAAGTPPSPPGELMSLFGEAGKATIVLASTGDMPEGGLPLGPGMGLPMGGSTGGSPMGMPGAGEAEEPSEPSSFEGLTVQADFDDGVDVKCKLRFGKAEEAMEAKGGLDMLAGMMTLGAAQNPEAAKAVPSITTDVQGGDLAINVRMTNEQIGEAVAAMTPALGRARGEARKTQSRSNLRQIGLAMVMYATDRQGKGPKSLRELFDEGYLTQKGEVVLRDPCVADDQRAGDTDYVLRREVADGSMRVTEALSEPTVWSDPRKVDTVNVLFGDGSVKSIPVSQIPRPGGGGAASTQWPELIEALKSLYRQY